MKCSCKSVWAGWKCGSCGEKCRWQNHKFEQSQVHNQEKYFGHNYLTPIFCCQRLFSLWWRMVLSTSAFVQTLMKSLHPCLCKTQFIFFYWLNSLNRQICCLPRTWSTVYDEKLMRMFFEWPTILKCKFLEWPTILTPDFSFRKKRKIVRSVKLGQLRHAARLAGWDLQPEIHCSFIYIHFPPFGVCLLIFWLIDIIGVTRPW